MPKNGDYVRWLKIVSSNEKIVDDFSRAEKMFWENIGADYKCSSVYITQAIGPEEIGVSRFIRSGECILYLLVLDEYNLLLRRDLPGDFMRTYEPEIQLIHKKIREKTNYPAAVWLVLPIRRLDDSIPPSEIIENKIFVSQQFLAGPI